MGFVEKIRARLVKKLGIYNICGHSFYGGNLSADSIVVDLGANQGSFSQEINRAFRCKVYAVEPDPALFRQIPETDSIKKFNCAISEENGPTTLYLSNNPTAHTTDPHIQKLWKHGKSVTVDAMTLESFLKRMGITSVDLLKIDIEGAEVAMFKSASDALLRDIKQITIEMHAFAQRKDQSHIRPYEEITQRLKKIGFIPLLFGTGDMDMLFLNKKTVSMKLKHRFYTHALLLINSLRKIFFHERNWSC